MSGTPPSPRLTANIRNNISSAKEKIVSSSKLFKDTDENQEDNKTITMLRNKIQLLEKKAEDYESLYTEYVALKTDAVEKETDLSLKIKSLDENVSVLTAKLEKETSRSTDAKIFYAAKLKEESSKVQTLKEGNAKLHAFIGEMKKEKDRLNTKLEDVKTSPSSGMSPCLVKKLKKFKANYNILKTENKLLKQKLQNKDMLLSEHKSLEEFFQSSSDDGSEDTDIDVNPTFSKGKNTESVAPPPPVRSSKTKSFFRAPSPTSESSRVSHARKVSFADQILTPMGERVSSSSESFTSSGIPLVGGSTTTAKRNRDTSSTSDILPAEEHTVKKTKLNKTYTEKTRR